MKTLLIIDYEAGNIHSVINAFQALAKDWKIIVSGEVADFKKADKLVLPGVGSFRHCAVALESKDGLKPELLSSIANQTPTLGICVGMQLLFEHSSEQSKTKGLGLFEAAIEGFKDQASCANLKIPHMGWNQIVFNPDHPLFHSLHQPAHVYYANSFFAPMCSETIATSHYGLDFSAAVAKNHLMGVQFHPEKSQKVGLRILQNFLNL